jgi:hypothetical protein
MYVIRRNIAHDYLMSDSGWTFKLENARTFKRRITAEKVAKYDTDSELGYVGHIKEFLQEPE